MENAICKTSITHQFDVQYHSIPFIVIGWLLTLCGVLPLIVIAAATLCRAEGDTFAEKLRRSLRPTVAWGPADAVRNAEYQQFVSDREAADTETGWLRRIRVNIFGVPQQQTKM